MSEPPPAVGFHFDRDGQSYVVVGARPYVTTQRGPGRTITMVDWRTECPTCGTGFFTTSPRSRMPETRRCKACRKPGKRVAAERRKAAAIKAR
jgi:hypothetical protein